MNSRKPSCVCLLLLGVVFCVLSACSQERPKESWAHDEIRLVRDVLESVCPAASLSRLSSVDYKSFIAGLYYSSKDHQVDRALIAAVMAVESRCLPDARSPVGAIGPMQLMPTTVAWLGVEDPGSIRENIDAGAKYLSMMISEFDGDLRLALAAYNAGPSKVKRYKRIPPYRETKNFVNKVLAYYSLLQEPSGEDTKISSV